mmetsp:Transcript_3815/g.12160  ORF Transcript_3815/g.12160 Transcript_3815/m.12160 type:complete len:205 (-) Transcript_3815:132-746(-)
MADGGEVRGLEVRVQGSELVLVVIDEVLQAVSPLQSLRVPHLGPHELGLEVGLLLALAPELGLQRLRARGELAGVLLAPGGVALVVLLEQVPVTDSFIPGLLQPPELGLEPLPLAFGLPQGTCLGLGLPQRQLVALLVLGDLLHEVATLAFKKGYPEFRRAHLPLELRSIWEGLAGPRELWRRKARIAKACGWHVQRPRRLQDL